MPDDVTIKVALSGQLLKIGRSGWTGSVGRFEAASPRKPEVVQQLADLVKQAVERRDLGAVVRVGVTGEEVHVLHVRHDGRYEIVRAPLPAPGEWSEPRHHGPDVEDRHNAVDIFADRLERAQAAIKAPAISDAESALRLLAAQVGVPVADDCAVDWRVVAQQTARVFADARRESDGVRALASESRVLAELAGNDPEAAALARLLGLLGSFDGRADPSRTRAEALAILAESPGQRFARTLTDAREGQEQWLHLVDRLTGGESVEDEISDRIERGELVDAEEVTRVAMEDGDWEDDGEIDKAFAKAIEDDTLPSRTEKALQARLSEANHDGAREERERLEDADTDARKAVLAVLEIDRDTLDGMSCGAIVDELQSQGVTRAAFADLLGDDYEERANVPRLLELMREKWERVLVGTEHHGQLHSRHIRAEVDAMLVIPAKVYEKRWLHDIDGVQVYLGEDDHWHVEHAAGHETDSSWKREDAVARACVLVDLARDVVPGRASTIRVNAAQAGSLAGVEIEEIADKAPPIRVWPKLGPGHVLRSSVGPLLSVETHDLETTLISITDVVAWQRARVKYGPLDHLDGCVLTLDENGHDIYACPPDCPAAVVEQRDTAMLELQTTLDVLVEVEDRVRGLTADLASLCEELQNRGLVSALPVKVRTLLNPED